MPRDDHQRLTMRARMETPAPTFLFRCFPRQTTPVGYAVGEDCVSRVSMISLNCRFGLAPINFSAG